MGKGKDKEGDVSLPNVTDKLEEHETSTDAKERQGGSDASGTVDGNGKPNEEKHSNDLGDGSGGGSSAAASSGAAEDDATAAAAAAALSSSSSSSSDDDVLAIQLLREMCPNFPIALLVIAVEKTKDEDGKPLVDMALSWLFSSGESYMNTHMAELFQ